LGYSFPIVYCIMLRRKATQEKKTPVKGEPVKIEKPVIDTICAECGKKRPYSNKSKKLCTAKES
jgi:hypothetical protein